MESDSDLGTMTGDTDTEADRLELLRSEGVAMENISEVPMESEDEVTQVENTNVRNYFKFSSHEQKCFFSETYAVSVNALSWRFTFA